MTTIWDAIPADGFFPKYLRYALSVTDAPELYHVGSSLAAFATAVSGRAKLEFQVPNGATAEFPLHMWIMLLGKSAARKSSACDRALKVFDPFVGERGPTGGSPEAFYQWISKKPACMFYFTEMAALFGLQQASYWQQGSTFFTEVYDGQNFKRTLMSSEKNKKGGKKVLEVEIIAPRVTLLGCATPSLLDNSTREVDWTGGMIGRMMPFYADRTTLTVFPNLKFPETEDQLRNLIASVLDAVGDGVAIGMTRSAMKAYEEWARRLDGTIEDYPERMQALITRLPQHVLRVAALFALSTMYADVDVDLMLRAINLGDIAQQTILKLGEMLTPDRVARLVKNLRQRLLQCPSYTASVRDMLKMMNLSWKTLEPAYKSMAEAGELVLIADQATKKKWLQLTEIPASMMRATIPEEEGEAGIDFPMPE